VSETAPNTTVAIADVSSSTTAESQPPAAAAIVSDGILNAATKRLFDIAAACCGLVLCAPLWAIIAAAIKLNSRGPVLFRQQRPGKDKHPFVLLKFRTMCDNAEEKLPQVMHLNSDNGNGDPLLRIQNDPRVTRVGRLLRMTSLDETPQLINILKGDMSLVGPRPISRQLDNGDPRTHLRLAVRPGLTGVWQVSGRKETDCDYMLEKDMEYLRNRSFWYDLKIILKTVPAVFRGNGAW